MILQRFELNYLYKSNDLYKDISKKLLQELLDIYVYLLKLLVDLLRTENVEDVC